MAVYWCSKAEMRIGFYAHYVKVMCGPRACVLFYCEIVVEVLSSMRVL